MNRSDFLYLILISDYGWGKGRLLWNLGIYGVFRPKEGGKYEITRVRVIDR